MSVRKTVKVQTVLDRANHYLRESDDMAQRERMAVAGLCETLLHDANAYAGFMYLPSAGLQFEENVCVDIADESRRCYYKHVSLQT